MAVDGDLLPSRPHGTVSRTQRHASVDCRTTIGLRVDGKLPIHEFDPLRHADKAKPEVFIFSSTLKPDPESRTVRSIASEDVAQFRIEVPHAAVLDPIVQGFL